MGALSATDILKKKRRGQGKTFGKCTFQTNLRNITRKGDMATHNALMHRDVNNNANVKLFTCPFEPCGRTLVKHVYIKTT